MLDPALASLTGLRRANRRSLGNALGFPSNEEAYFWVDTLSRLGLYLDLSGFRAESAKAGEQSRVLFDPRRDYVVKLLYKEHRGRPAGSAFTAFELAHRRLGQFVPPMLLGRLATSSGEDGSGAAAREVARVLSRGELLRDGKKLVDGLVSTIRRIWQRGIFDGDLFGLAGNRPGIAADGSLLMLDFGSVEDALQDRLFEVQGDLRDDPFHMAIDKLHVTRDELESIRPWLARRFEHKVQRRLGLRLLPPGAWTRGRKGSRGEEWTVRLADELRAAVKALRPLQAPSDRYALPWLGSAPNVLAAAAVRRRLSYAESAAWASKGGADDRMDALVTSFPHMADTVRRLVDHPLVGLDAVWRAHQITDLGVPLELLSDPRLECLFHQGVELLERSRGISTLGLASSLRSDLGQAVLAVLALAASPAALTALQELARPDALGSEATDGAFLRNPIRLAQALERICCRWPDGSGAHAEESLVRRIARLAELGGTEGESAVRRAFVQDSLTLVRVLMVLAEDHNLPRSVAALEPVLGGSTLRRLHRDDLLTFAHVLDVPGEVRRDLAARWRNLCRLGIAPEALRGAFLIHPRFFMRTVPFLGDAWAEAMGPEYCRSPDELDVAAFVRHRKARLVFVSSNVAGLRSTRGVVEALRLPPDVYAIGLRNQLRDEVELVRRHFPDQELTRNLQPGRGRIVLRWVNRVRAPIQRLPHAPFKCARIPRATPAERRERRRVLGLGDRPLIIVCSPHPWEVRIVVDALRRLGPSDAAAGPPLTVFGMRNPDGRLADELRNRGWRTAARDRPDDPWPTEPTDLVVLNTTGELLWLLGAADLAIVGMDRNVFEPASQGVPILHFDGPWLNNQNEKRLLVDHGATRAVRPHRLAEQIAEILARPPTRTCAGRACRALENEVLPSAGLLASLAVTHLVAEDAARPGAGCPRA